MKEYDELKSEIDKSNLKSSNFVKNKSNKSKTKIDYDLLSKK